MFLFAWSFCYQDWNLQDWDCVESANFTEVHLGAGLKITCLTNNSTQAKWKMASQHLFCSLIRTKWSSKPNIWLKVIHPFVMLLHRFRQHCNHVLTSFEQLICPLYAVLVWVITRYSTHSSLFLSINLYFLKNLQLIETLVAHTSLPLKVTVWMSHQLLQNGLSFLNISKSICMLKQMYLALLYKFAWTTTV